jgi:hypothetical protein
MTSARPKNPSTSSPRGTLAKCESTACNYLQIQEGISRHRKAIVPLGPAVGSVTT